MVVEAAVAFKAAMRRVVIVDRRSRVEVYLLHRPVECAISVAHRERTVIARDEDGYARVIRAHRARVFVEVDRRAEGGPVVGGAGEGKRDVDILNELGHYGTRAALDTQLG
jgi:hypothetical protein